MGILGLTTAVSSGQTSRRSRSPARSSG